MKGFGVKDTVVAEAMPNLFDLVEHAGVATQYPGPCLGDDAETAPQSPIRKSLGPCVGDDG